MKEQRWYEIVDGVLYVYDAPCANRATACSMVPVCDLAYYRATFTLRKVWAQA